MGQEAQRLLQKLTGEQGFPAELRRRVAGKGGVVVLPEADDLRVLSAAIALREAISLILISSVTPLPAMA